MRLLWESPRPRLPTSTPLGALGRVCRSLLVVSRFLILRPFWLITDQARGP